MASNRHLGRVIVLQSLYEYELRTLAKDPQVDLDIIIAKNIEPYEKTLGDTEFVYALTRNVRDNFETLDATLAPMAPEWPISSIAAIDRNVLRMGLYELSECRDKVPPKVAINEAVELAKAFGSENSSRFINGVLGTAYRKLGISEESNNGSNNKEKADRPADKAKAPAGASVAAKADGASDGAAASGSDTESKSGADSDSDARTEGSELQGSASDAE